MRVIALYSLHLKIHFLHENVRDLLLGWRQCEWLVGESFLCPGLVWEQNFMFYLVKFCRGGRSAWPGPTSAL